MSEGGDKVADVNVSENADGSVKATAVTEQGETGTGSSTISSESGAAEADASGAAADDALSKSD